MPLRTMGPNQRGKHRRRPKPGIRPEHTEPFDPMVIWQAAAMAAQELGSDGKGAGGVKGFMMDLGRKDKRDLVMVLSRPPSIKATMRPRKTYRNRNEIKAEMRARGIPFERFYPPQFEHDDDPPELTKDVDPKGKE